MKKLLLIVVVSFIIITFFIIDKKDDNTRLVINEEKEVRGLFISYLELNEYIMGKSEEIQKQNINKILTNMKDNKFNLAILHVRPFSDAIYDSNIFPTSKYISGTEGVKNSFDVLKYFIKEAHKLNIDVHAWINPYRIRSTTNTSDIAKSSPFYILSDNDVKIIEDKGIYYNPSSEEVKKLIIRGIEEIVRNYDIDGIHFDDYFYPDTTIDLNNYEEYKKNGGTISISEYRMDNVLDLIKRVNVSIKKINKNVLFGISPEGNINNDYDIHFLDVKTILSNSGYVDYIMPQIYYGFNNEVMPYLETVKMWNDLIKVDSIKLIPALGIYKSGYIDIYAKSGSDEWIDNTNIISKQILVSRNLNHYGGFALFRYDYLFNDKLLNDNIKKEKDNLLSLIN